MAKSSAVAVGGDCLAAYESFALAGPPVAYRACAYCAVVDDSILEKTNRSRESVNAARVCLAAATDGSRVILEHAKSHARGTQNRMPVAPQDPNYRAQSVLHTHMNSGSYELERVVYGTPQGFM